jgi:hypothetical protein
MFCQVEMVLALVPFNFIGGVASLHSPALLLAQALT